MQCPIFSYDEDFCLHENCRYYDTDLQACIYLAGISKKREQETPAASGVPATEKPEENTAIRQVGLVQENRTPSPLRKETVPREQDGDRSEETAPCDGKMNAKEVWDRLKRYHESEGIPDYESLIESLIQVVNSTPGIHYLTPKEVDFWCSRVHGARRYLVGAETVQGELLPHRQ